MNGFYKFIRAIMIVITKTILPMKVVGKENFPKGEGVILCCNHTSMSDVVYLIAATDRMIHFMGKQELFETKIMSFLYNKMGVFPVKRGAGDRSAIEFAENTAKNGAVVGIFPEGTRSKDNTAPGKGKSGAVVIASESGTAIIPAAICRNGRFRLFRKTTLRFGEIIPADSLASVFDGKTAIKASVTLLMDKITKLWEQGI